MNEKVRNNICTDYVQIGGCSTKQAISAQLDGLT